MALGLDGADDLFEGFGIQVAEGEVFKFAANFAHAEPVGDGSIDFDGFARDALSPLVAQVAERAHVMQTIRQLHDDDANVIHHGQQHFAKAFRLPLFGGEVMQLAQLGDAVDTPRDLFAEALADLVDGHAGVFHQVVQDAGLDGHQIHAHVGQDVGDHQGMDHVWLAGIARLALVELASCVERFLDRS